MDGITAQDLPILLLLIAGIAATAAFLFWLPRYLPFTRSRELVFRLFFVILLASNLIISVSSLTSTSTLVQFAFLMWIGYLAWQSWRSRNAL
ncbi:MAG: hypothetical protein P0Y64_05160 [Candidatus Sphingomonas colombiensis]|nr:hypothetical protein [Sphingomonas sp.]WEK44207.1 MAG: hypothetical protein P0Y64_05160 [Sphingomonas sp.]